MYAMLILWHFESPNSTIHLSWNVLKSTLRKKKLTERLVFYTHFSVLILWKVEYQNKFFKSCFVRPRHSTFVSDPSLLSDTSAKADPQFRMKSKSLTWYGLSWQTFFRLIDL